MNYCSLKDAWGSNDYISTQFKDYMKPQTVEKETFANTNNDEDEDEPVVKPIKKKNMEMNDISCYQVIEHVRRCKKCYKKLHGLFKPNLLGGFENIINENRDVIVMILIGISIMLFFNLVNNITK